MANDSLWGFAIGSFKEKNLRVWFLVFGFLFSTNLMAAKLVSKKPKRGIAVLQLTSNERRQVVVGQDLLMRVAGFKRLAQGRVVRISGSRAFVRVFVNFRILNSFSTVLLKPVTQQKIPGGKKLVERDKRYQKRWGFLSVLGDVEVFSESILLYGASVGLQLTSQLEVEGSYAMGVSLQDRIATVEQRELTASQEFTSFGGRVRYYPWDLLNVGVGFRYLQVAEPRSLKLVPLGESTALAEEDDFNYFVPPYSGDHSFIETTLGVRLDVETLALGESFALGLDVGMSFEVSVANSSDISYRPFDDVFGAEGLMAFGRAYAGLVF